jgi:hypothetical protein
MAKRIRHHAHPEKEEPKPPKGGNDVRGERHTKVLTARAGSHRQNKNLQCEPALLVQEKRISRPSEKFEVGAPPDESRNQHWKRQVSPELAAAGPLGWGSAERSAERLMVPPAPEF